MGKTLKGKKGKRATQRSQNEIMTGTRGEMTEPQILFQTDPIPGCGLLHCFFFLEPRWKIANAVLLSVDKI